MMPSRSHLWIAAAGMLLLARATYADVEARIAPDEKTVNLNDVFTLEIRADNLADVTGWGLDLTNENPGIISLIDNQIEAPWRSANGFDADGLCAVVDPFQSGPVAGSDMLLATLTFSADALGDAYLSLGVTPGDLTEGFPTSIPGEFLPAQYSEGLVHVVPEPSGLLLSIPMLMFIARRRG
jgi:hypothetical protein